MAFQPMNPIQSIQPLAPLPGIKQNKDAFIELAKVLQGQKSPTQPKMIQIKTQKSRMPRQASTRGGDYSNPFAAVNSLMDVFGEKHEEDLREQELQRVGTSRASTADWLSNDDVHPDLADEIMGVAMTSDPDGIDFYQGQQDRFTETRQKQIEKEKEDAYNQATMDAISGLPATREEGNQYFRDNPEVLMGDHGDLIMDIFDQQFEDANEYKPDIQNVRYSDGTVRAMDLNDPEVRKTLEEDNVTIHQKTKDSDEDGGGAPTLDRKGAIAYLANPNSNPESPYYAAAWLVASESKRSVDQQTGEVVELPGLDPTMFAANGSPTNQAWAQASEIDISGETDTAATPKVSADQAKNIGFADRLWSAENTFNTQTGFDSTIGDEGTSLLGYALDQVPFGLGNYAQTPEYQQFLQAEGEWINAFLRRDSGAAIADSERSEARKVYIPVPGDSPEVLQQKASARNAVMGGFADAAGPTYSRPWEANQDKTVTTQEAPVQQQQQQQEPIDTILPPEGLSWDVMSWPDNFNVDLLSESQKRRLDQELTKLGL